MFSPRFSAIRSLRHAAIFRHCAMLAGIACLPLAASQAQPPAPVETAPPSPNGTPHATPQLATAIPPASLLMPIAIDLSTRMTLPVRIGGRGPYDFVVDTGAERTVIATELAAELGLPVVGRARVVGMANAVDTNLVDPGMVFLAHLTLAPGQVPTFARAHLGANGLIGIESLQNHKIIFDFVANTVDLRESSRRTRNEVGFDDGAIVVTARRRAGRLILANATVNGRRVDIVIDTGAQASVGNRALQALAMRQSSRVRALSPTVMQSVTGGTMMVDRAVIPRITVNGVDFTNFPVAYGDSPAFAELGLARRPAILLGMDALRLFDRVSVDFANHRVTFDLPDGATRATGARFAGHLRSPAG